MHISRFNMIANQLMFGGGFNDKKGVSPEAIETFKEQHKDLINWIGDNLPRTSVGVLGAVGKAILWYGKDKIIPFCRALRHGDFKGEDDPAHILWRWLFGRAHYTAKVAYRNTVTAIRFYLDGRTMVRINKKKNQKMRPSITPAESDFFNWANNFTIMMRTYSNKTKIECQAVGKDKEVRLVEIEPLDDMPVIDTIT